MSGPRWWQRLIPRYGNWGGPGWSSGKWCPPGETDWFVSGVDDLDEAFKRHDWKYQNGVEWDVADAELLRDMDAIPCRRLTWRARIYRRLSMAVFATRAKL